MLLRLLEPYRWGSHDLVPGTLVDLDIDEASVLIEQGIAVPTTLREEERHKAEVR